jgi:hypothetical protein
LREWTKSSPRPDLRYPQPANCLWRLTAQQAETAVHRDTKAGTEVITMQAGHSWE